VSAKAIADDVVSISVRCSAVLASIEMKIEKAKDVAAMEWILFEYLRGHFALEHFCYGALPP
jgi:hypothetical protein